MGMCDWVYLDGQIQAARDARVPLFDRGLLFGHSVYEVTGVAAGRLIDSGAHLARLERSLNGVDLTLPLSLDEIEAIQVGLCRKNNLREGVIYLQVTAGDYGDRDFTGPKHLRPRLFAFCQARPLVDERARDGIAAMTLEDTRWARRDLKTTQLVSQVLAYRAARQADAFSAIMHENGMVTEAASANVWIVGRDGILQTRDLSPAILGGVTRSAILGIEGVNAREAPFSLEELRRAREVFLSSSGGLILPVVRIDSVPVEAGEPGRVTREIQAAYWEKIGVDL